MITNSSTHRARELSSFRSWQSVRSAWKRDTSRRMDSRKLASQTSKQQEERTCQFQAKNLNLSLTPRPSSTYRDWARWPTQQSMDLGIRVKTLNLTKYSKTLWIRLSLRWTSRRAVHSVQPSGISLIERRKSRRWRRTMEKQENRTNPSMRRSTKATEMKTDIITTRLARNSRRQLDLGRCLLRNLLSITWISNKEAWSAESRI